MECARDTGRIFSEMHREHQTSYTYLSQNVNKYRETGYILNLRRDNTRNELSIGILGKLSNNQHVRCSRRTRITKSSFDRILKKHKSQSYKIDLVYSLN